MSRRVFLKRLGIGAGALTVVVSGGVAWPIIDQGVLAPGTGPAYEAWRASLTGDGALSLVRAAILAANAHDTQPWAFRIADERIDLFADRTRTLATVDPLGRELEISLGCALENLLLAAPANGYEATLTLLPDASAPDHRSGSQPPGRGERRIAVLDRHAVGCCRAPTQVRRAPRTTDTTRFAVRRLPIGRSLDRNHPAP